MEKTGTEAAAVMRRYCLKNRTHKSSRRMQTLRKQEEDWLRWQRESFH